MSLIERSVKQPVAVSVVVLLLVMFGLISLTRVPIQLTPNVDQPVVSVTTQWFGASPQEIVREIIEEQEDKLKNVNGLKQMTSQSTDGEGVVRLEFDIGVDRQAALNEVRDKLREVEEYPQDVDEPIVESVDKMSRDYIAWMLIRPIGGADTPTIAPDAAPGFTGDVTELQDFIDDEVKPVLERAVGVSEVNVFGGRERETQVLVDMEKLAARGIQLGQLVEALKSENADVTAGTIDEGKRRTSIRAVGQYEAPEQILRTVVAWTPDGAPVYVRDVAEVKQSFKKQVSFVRSLGADVIALNAQREPGSNVLVVMDNLRERIKEVNEQILGPKKWGLELHQVYDQTVYVDRSVKNASQDLLLGGALALIVLFLTLRSIGATVVVGVSIPISVIGTFLGMYLAGRNLNVISMAGLAFAIGMGVDNTIVVLENIFRHREMGKKAFQAALDGTKEVWGAIVAATLANIAVFLPVVFIQQEAGQLFKDISIAISISLFLYMVVSPTVIPMLATLFLRRMPGGFKETDHGIEEEESHTALGRWTRPFSKVVAEGSELFRKIVFWLTGGIVRRVALVVVMIGLAAWGSWALQPPRTYVPTGNQNLMFAFVIVPPGYNMEELRSMGQQVQRVLEPWWTAKEGSPELKKLQEGWLARREAALPQQRAMIEGKRGMMAAQKMPEEKIQALLAPDIAKLRALERSPAPSAIENFFFVATPGGVFMGATSKNMQNVAPLDYLFQEAAGGIPGTFVFAQQMPLFRLGGFGTGIEVNISGPDVNRVRGAAGQAMGMIMGKFSRFPLSQPQNFSIPRPEMQITVDHEKAAANALTGQDLRQVAQVAVDGAIIGDYRVGGRAIDLTVKMNAHSESRYSQDLGQVPVATRDGRIVQLGTVAKFIDTTAPQQIDRLEERPSVRLTVPLQPGETVEEIQNRLVADVIEPLKQGGVISADMTVRYTGSADKLQTFLKEFQPIFILAALITYLLLAALFESWLHPFTIIMSVPFALVGGFLGLRILHTFEPSILLDVLTMLGFVILIGTIVNNPILIVHQALNNMRDGMGKREAIAHSTQTRVRPIFMSVITSVAGMAPLVVFGGAGSELYRGLGAVVIGGLLVSTIFTLLLTPTLMSLMIDMSDGIKGMFRRRPPALPPAPPDESRDQEPGGRRRDEIPEAALARLDMPPQPRPMT